MENGDLDRKVVLDLVSYKQRELWGLRLEIVSALAIWLITLWNLARQREDVGAQPLPRNIIGSITLSLSTHEQTRAPSLREISGKPSEADVS
jgi:hypothetical protein